MALRIFSSGGRGGGYGEHRPEEENHAVGVPAGMLCIGFVTKVRATTVIHRAETTRRHHGDVEHINEKGTRL